MTRIRPRCTAVVIAAVSLAIGACSREANTDAANATDATGKSVPEAGKPIVMEQLGLVGAAGEALGTVSVSGTSSGSTLTIAASGMPTGIHGIHLHEKGLCEGPKFTSAGGHWNPGKKQHGRDNPQGAHLGDLANLTIAADGSASTNVNVSGASGGSIADADGTALVIHAKADDYKTDPSGNSGDRIACAVLAPPR